MKKLIFAIALAMAFSGAAWAAVDCNQVGLCKYNLPIEGGPDCSVQECVVIFGASDNPGGTEDMILAAAVPSCNDDLQPLGQFTLPVDPDTSLAARLFTLQGLNPGDPYALAVFFSGCEQAGTCQQFVWSDPNPDCFGSGSLNLKNAALQNTFYLTIPTNK